MFIYLCIYVFVKFSAFSLYNKKKKKKMNALFRIILKFNTKLN